MSGKSIPLRTAACVIFVSVHYGPYLTLRPVADVLGARACFLLDGPSHAAHRAAGLASWELPCSQGIGETFEGFLRDRKLAVMIVGTSENLPQNNIEARALMAAGQAGIPAYVIEDFPGNYRHRPGASLAGLFVEDPSLIEVHAKRGVEPNRIHCIANPRYDGLRDLDRQALRRAVRTRLNAGTRKVILWAGQPDQALSLEAFARLAPVMLGSGGVLWFKAHPRDESYRRGAYRDWLDLAPVVIDVTSEKETAGLCCAADLVVTQFSSVGVEAGYLGTPTLYVLFDDLGVAYLQRHKGYSIVPWAISGSAFLLLSADRIPEQLNRALYDEDARASVRRNFHERYGVRPFGATAVAASIDAALQGTA